MAAVLCLIRAFLFNLRGVPRVDDRRVIAGIVQVLQSGSTGKGLHGASPLLHIRNHKVLTVLLPFQRDDLS